jgi:SAM-dependent methyltransferase
VENNRRYVQNYFMPNDEDEQLRLQIIHQVYLSMLDSKLTTVSLRNPTKILDIGTGTGEWAIGMAETYPQADVTGVDLSAIQPTAVPPNVFFEIFDAEDDDDWTYPENSFDLIHFRNMAGSFRSWDLMYERAYRHLKPGGWIEVVDFDDQENGFYSYLGKDSELRSWHLALIDASNRAGKGLNHSHLDPERIANAGFQDVDVTRNDVPMGAWPTDPSVRSTAKLWLVACLAGFEAYSLRPLTRDLGWSAEEVHRICKKIETELKSFALDKEKAEGMSVAITIVVGRKPMSPSDEDAARLGNRYGLEVDDDQPDCKRVKTRASSQEEIATSRQGDDSDFVIVPEMMQELRKRFRRAGDIAQDGTTSNGVNMAYRGSAGDVEMKL